MKKSTCLILVIGLLSAGLMYFWPIEEIRLVQFLLSLYFVLMMWIFCGTLDRPRWYAYAESLNMLGALIVLAGSCFRPDTYQHLWPVFMFGLTINTIASAIYIQFFRSSDIAVPPLRKALYYVLGGVLVVLAVFGIERCTRESHRQTELLEKIADHDSISASPALTEQIKQVDLKVSQNAAVDSAQTDSLAALTNTLYQANQNHVAEIPSKPTQTIILFGVAKPESQTALAHENRDSVLTSNTLTPRQRRQLKRAARKQEKFSRRVWRLTNAHHNPDSLRQSSRH